MFLYFILLERILNGEPTAFQRNSARTFLLLGTDDVRMIPNDVWMNPREFPGAWALVDSNIDLVQPRTVFSDARSQYFVVQATSPQPVRWKAWMKQLSASMAVMKSWTWEEFYIGGSVCIDYCLLLFTIWFTARNKNFSRLLSIVGPYEMSLLSMVSPLAMATDLQGVRSSSAIGNIGSQDYWPGSPILPTSKTSIFHLYFS
jgi:hypothetical protein